MGLLVILLTNHAVAQQASWDGTYSYTHDGGRTTGGSPILQTWRLSVEGQTCLLLGEGFQLLETLRCSTASTPQSLDVHFVSFADGGSTNAAGVATYKKGEKLFTLSRNSGRLLTQWHRFIVDEGLPRTPHVWFQQAKPMAVTSRAASSTLTELFGAAVAIDGDTLSVEGMQADLWTIDAPELEQPCTRAGKPWNCGELSRQHLTRLIAGRSVACKRQGPPEPDARFVGLCFISDEPCARSNACETDLTSLNLAMVRQGWAVDFEGQYMDAQADAEEKQAGIWAGSFEAPWEWRAAMKRPGLQIRRRP